MFTFDYEIVDDYINWSAKWDGRHDNEPLLEDYEDELEHVPHPFCLHMDFIKREREFTDKDIPGTFTYNYIHGEGTKVHDTDGKVVFNWGPPNVDDFPDPNLMVETGDTVARNTMTEALCKMIKDSAYLNVSCGHTHAYWYRCSLIGNLSILWD